MTGVQIYIYFKERTNYFFEGNAKVALYGSKMYGTPHIIFNHKSVKLAAEKICMAPNTDQSNLEVCQSML